MFDLFIKFLESHLGLPSAFLAIIDPVLRSSTQTFLADATVAAKPIVSELEGGSLPSSAKLQSAVDSLIAKFKADGKALLPSVAHLAVELALQEIKNKL